jgi:arsenite-transporting ATPase
MVLDLDLPFTGHDDLDLGRAGDELLVRVGPYRRAIVLPDALRRRQVAGAELVGGCLSVSFTDVPPGAGAGDVTGAGTGPGGASGAPAAARAGDDQTEAAAAR